MGTDADLDTTLRLAEIVESTPSEGPGARFAVWVQGCLRRCEGCCNPEMFDLDGGREVPLREVARRLERVADRVEGISLLGGEPFLQAPALARLAEHARARGLGVVVFTGYRLEELQSSAEDGVGDLLAATDLLVDGPYDHARRSSRRRWIGSDNQRTHYVTERYRGHPDITEDHTQSVHICIRDGEVQLSGWPGLADELGKKVD